jgi:hypothetical protein
MPISKNTPKTLITYTSPHKSKDSKFSEKLNEFNINNDMRLFAVWTIRASGQISAIYGDFKNADLL